MYWYSSQFFLLWYMKATNILSSETHSKIWWRIFLPLVASTPNDDFWKLLSNYRKIRKSAKKFIFLTPTFELIFHLFILEPLIFCHWRLILKSCLQYFSLSKQLSNQNIFGEIGRNWQKKGQNKSLILINSIYPSSSWYF